MLDRFRPIALGLDAIPVWFLRVANASFRSATATATRRSPQLVHFCRCSTTAVESCRYHASRKIAKPTHTIDFSTYDCIYTELVLSGCVVILKIFH